MPSPILTVAQMRDWEAATWHAGISEASVIARAGTHIAEQAMVLTKPGEPILALAGKGHNGDDVRQTVPRICNRPCRLLEVVDPARQLPELARALETKPALIVDGLFGIGLNRPLDEAWKTFIERINRERLPLLAVDAPSGLNCDTGQPEGTAIRADVTLTLGAVKAGLLAATAVPFVGRIELARDIGLVPFPIETAIHWTLPGDFDHFPPRRRQDTHKGVFGHLVIVAGSLGYHGAAVLAARGGQAARPGLISVITTDEAYLPVAAQLQAAMVRPWASDWEPPGKTTAILFGPGLADATVPTGLRKQLVQLWQEFGGTVVADASGLDWVVGTSLKSRGIRLATPHPGEAARLLGATVAGVQADRIASIRMVSDKLGGAFVALKGYQTLVGSISAGVFVNATGGPSLSQGGSGDVLAGYLAGLLAQPQLASDPLLAIRYGVWRHGLAGESPDWNGFVDELPEKLTGSSKPKSASPATAQSEP